MDSEKDSRKRSSRWVLSSSECQNDFVFTYIFVFADGKTRPAISTSNNCVGHRAIGNDVCIDSQLYGGYPEGAKTLYIQPYNFSGIQGNPIKSGPSTLAGTFCTADGDAAPDASIPRKINTIQTTVGNTYQLSLCLAARVSHAVLRVL